jgi:hypothetical protein
MPYNLNCASQFFGKGLKSAQRQKPRQETVAAVEEDKPQLSTDLFDPESDNENSCFEERSEEEENIEPEVMGPPKPKGKKAGQGRTTAKAHPPAASKGKRAAGTATKAAAVPASKKPRKK